MDVKNEGVCLARQGSSRKSQISAHDISRVEFRGGGGEGTRVQNPLKSEHFAGFTPYPHTRFIPYWLRHSSTPVRLSQALDASVSAWGSGRRAAHAHFRTRKGESPMVNSLPATSGWQDFPDKQPKRQ